MDASLKRDFEWLMSETATEILQQTQDAFVEQVNVVRISRNLRAKTTASRAAMVMEQAQLRLRARRKFKLADRMFFTRRGLEQSTSQDIANYKSHRFTGLAAVADYCCGIGGDLSSLITRSGAQSSLGIEADNLTCLFARHNANLHLPANSAHQINVQQAPFADIPFDGLDGIHCDPDRRTQKRTVDAARFSPSVDEILDRVQPATNVAIKVAPATALPTRIDWPLEREWIGDRRECKQQVLWIGPFAKRPGFRTATCIDRNENIHQLSVAENEVDQTVAMARRVGHYVYEPHPAVLAASLTDSLANRFQLERFTSGIHYMTGDNSISNPLLSRFEVVEVLPLKVKPCIQFLKRHDIGTVEVKKRGVDNVVYDQFQRLKISGPNKATLILTRWGRKRIVMITRRKPGDFELTEKVTA